MSIRVTAALRRAVIARALGRCEYCGIQDAEALLPHEPDHVVARQHSGQTAPENLAYTCFQCNRYKGPNIASFDPATGTISVLFHPRTMLWTNHFRMRGAEIEPLTAIGRATAALLRFNDVERVRIRANLLARDRYHPPGA